MSFLADILEASDRGQTEASRAQAISKHFVAQNDDAVEALRSQCGIEDALIDESAGWPGGYLVIISHGDAAIQDDKGRSRNVAGS